MEHIDEDHSKMMPLFFKIVISVIAFVPMEIHFSLKLSSKDILAHILRLKRASGHTLL